MKIKLSGLIKSLTILLGLSGMACSQTEKPAKPNIIYIMSDDHTTQAVGVYNSRLAELDPTPNLDKLASEGVVFNNCYVTNSICTPSRACIMTGQYSNVNGVLDLGIPLEPEKHHLPHELKNLGYQTAMIGKWHLKTTPDFDYYKVLYEHGGQGSYFNPKFIETGTPYIKHRNDKPEKVVESKGHSSDVITDFTLDWLENKRDKSKPFFLMHHYKAPHDMFDYAPRYEDYLADIDVPEPTNLYVQPDFGSEATRGKNDSLYHKIGTSISSRHNHRTYTDIFNIDPDLPEKERTHQAYQVYLKKYLRCVKGVDDNLGRLFKYLKDNGLWENTVIIYTGDQGMMLGEHDYQDKRWMYDESMRMPFIVHYPEKIKESFSVDEIINNTDFAPTMINMAGGETPEYMQGRSIVPLLEGKHPEDWRKATYYRYWMHLIHHDIPAHFGIRTQKYKLIFFYGRHYDPSMNGKKSMSWLKESNLVRPTPVAWEFYDLTKDPHENVNRYDDQAYASVIDSLKTELKAMREDIGDTDEQYPNIKEVVDKYWE